MKDLEDSTVRDTVLHVARSNWRSIESNAVPGHRIALNQHRNPIRYPMATSAVL